LPWIWYPHLGRHKHPEKLPEFLEKINQDFDDRAKNDEEFLKLWMDKLDEHFDAGHVTQFLRPNKWFETDLGKIWADNKTPQLCTIYNYFLESILLNSGRFSREQIFHRTVFLNFSMHQFLEVKIKNGKKLELDLWGYDMGLPFGKGAKGFV
jgi:hypothetical protein